MPNEHWRDIPDAETAYSMPYTAALALALRDNIPGMSVGLAVDTYPLLEAAFNNGSLTGTTVFALESIDGEEKCAVSAITNSEVASNAVSVDKLITGIDSITVTAGNVNSTFITATNHHYLLGYESFGASGSQGARYNMGLCAGETADSGGSGTYNWQSNGTAGMYIWLKERIGTYYGATVWWQYVAACPPYELPLPGGDWAPAPLFIWALRRRAGRLDEIYISAEPPWAHRGPTCIVPNLWKIDPQTRRKIPWRRQRVLPPLADLRDPAKRDRAIALLRKSEWEEYPIDRAAKAADLPLYPHPWIGQEAAVAERQVLLLDPTTPVMEELAELHLAKECVADLLLRGDLRLGDEVAAGALPEAIHSSGVSVIGVDWR